MRRKTGSKRNRNGLIAALDVGSTKVCCLIAAAGDGEAPRIVGIGHQVSRGLRSGAVVDMEAAETAIRATVEAAEQMAGENIRQAIVNISGGTPESRLIAYEVSIAGHEIGDSDLRRILDPAEAETAMAPDSSDTSSDATETPVRTGPPPVGLIVGAAAIIAVAVIVFLILGG